MFFFERFFAHNYSKSLVEWILTCVLEFEFLTQSDDYEKALHDGQFLNWSHFSNMLCVCVCFFFF